MRKTKLTKILGISLGFIAGVIFLGFTIYVILYYPRKTESFEHTADNPARKILIATQGSAFKNSLTGHLCDSLLESSVYIKGIDVKDLGKVKQEEWDRIIILNSFIISLNKRVDRFISSSSTPEKILLFVTSGGADWQPEPGIRVDALTSASREAYIHSLLHLISDWVENKSDRPWVPDNYLLALSYFPRVNVDAALESIVSEIDRYKELYPNLQSLINQVGYQFLRLKKYESANKVFRMNVDLFPDSWNVYDSYGEVLAIQGERESAITNYQKALELNPGSESTRQNLERLIKEQHRN